MHKTNRDISTKLVRKEEKKQRKKLENVAIH